MNIFGATLKEIDTTSKILKVNNRPRRDLRAITIKDIMRIDNNNFIIMRISSMNLINQRGEKARFAGAATANDERVFLKIELVMMKIFDTIKVGEGVDFEERVTGAIGKYLGNFFEFEIFRKLFVKESFREIKVNTKKGTRGR